jgi:hypothetical protein
MDSAQIENPAGVSDAVLWAIAKNSIRHLVEADEHFKKQRYPSALASAG